MCDGVSDFRANSGSISPVLFPSLTHVILYKIFSNLLQSFRIFIFKNAFYCDSTLAFLLFLFRIRSDSFFLEFSFLLLLLSFIHILSFIIYLFTESSEISSKLSLPHENHTERISIIHLSLWNTHTKTWTLWRTHSSTHPMPKTKMK